MLNPQQMSQITKAAQSGAAISFDPWEKNQGVVTLRKIHAGTKMGEARRLDAARLQMPYIKALWDQMSSGLTGMALPKPMKTFMNNMFDRVRNDRDYARLVYNIFPLIADRYGAGTQSNGRPRLSFVRMKDDPDCARLRR